MLVSSFSFGRDLRAPMPPGLFWAHSVPSKDSRKLRIANKIAKSNLREKTPELPKGVFNWIGAFFKISDEYVMSHQCLDGFLLLRYLKISVAICLFGCIVTWPVLFPVNATGHGGQIELNSISFSNISNSNGRYYAHTFVAWIFFGKGIAPYRVDLFG